ncbi:hypothetical protein [Paenibacillus sp. 32O-W]|uniref:hypothetical protein n=1 Tax=Paenibacillus sp. 32O-W TaxID=1695218 RepID=UPI00164330F9|nr:MULTISPECIES: hypothetical protein [Paenibacillaceae]
MTENNKEYMLTDFNGHDELLNDLIKLEDKIRGRMGEHVHLIAYTRSEEGTECRPGLSD